MRSRRNPTEFSIWVRSTMEWSALPLCASRYRHRPLPFSILPVVAQFEAPCQQEAMLLVRRGRFVTGYYGVGLVICGILRPWFMDKNPLLVLRVGLVHKAQDALEVSQPVEPRWLRNLTGNCGRGYPQRSFSHKEEVSNKLSHSSVTQRGMSDLRVVRPMSN